METHFAGEHAQHRTGARSAPARSRPAIVLIAVAARCWAITARRMQGMDMGPGTDLGGLGWFAVVWATMMAAMMLPSLVPMALTLRGCEPSRAARPRRRGAPVVFAVGYLLDLARRRRARLRGRSRAFARSTSRGSRGIAAGPYVAGRRDPRRRPSTSSRPSKADVPAPLPQARAAHRALAAGLRRARCDAASSTAASASARAGR